MLLEGKVAIVTGSGRGIGREEALLMAKHGAKVVVNDLGAHFDGTGQPNATPAQDVVAEIKKAGGEAIANGESVSDHKAAKRLRMEGFIVMDFYDRRAEAEARLARWVAEGKIPPPLAVTRRIRRWKASEVQRHLDSLARVTR